MQIFIKTINGKTITFNYNYNYNPKLNEVIEVIEKKIGIPAKYQRLEFPKDSMKEKLLKIIILTMRILCINIQKILLGIETINDKYNHCHICPFDDKYIKVDL